MAWKFDENGNIVLDDNKNPIFVDDVSGNEKGIDYSAVSTEKSNLIKESVGRKNKIQELEKQYAIFQGIDDLGSWKSQAEKAIEQVASYSDDEKSREETYNKRLQSSLDPLQKELAEYKAHLETERHARVQEKISNDLFRSKYVSEKIAQPALIAELFSKNFKMIDGGVIAGHDSNGEVLYHDGKVADFDQALAQMVESSPFKDTLLKGSSSSGSGATGGNSNGSQGNTKSYADCKTTAEKAEWVKNNRK